MDVSIHLQQEKNSIKIGGNSVNQKINIMQRLKQRGNLSNFLNNQLTIITSCCRHKTSSPNKNNKVLLKSKEKENSKHRFKENMNVKPINNYLTHNKRVNQNNKSPEVYFFVILFHFLRKEQDPLSLNVQIQN